MVHFSTKTRGLPGFFGKERGRFEKPSQNKKKERKE
jgi:hypothetical protein